jgi:mono/diheme cytochrome c family protein
MVAVGGPAAAFAYVGSTPTRLVGNPKLGKPAFQTTCGVCHRLRAAGSTSGIGPDLDRVLLTEATIIKAITYGGASVMTKTQVARYTTEMTPYGKAMTTSQIADIAAFVYTATHPRT